MIHIAAHGRDHLFAVHDGKLLWWAHSPASDWAKPQVLASGAVPAAVPAVWLGGAVPPAAGKPPTGDLFLQVSVELADGGALVAFTAPAADWKTILLPAAA